MFEALANAPPSSESMLDELGGLMEGIRQGDESALETLYEATVGKLYALGGNRACRDHFSDGCVAARSRPVVRVKAWTDRGVLQRARSAASFLR